MPDKERYEILVEGPREPVKLSISTYKGKEYLNIRHWYYDKAGELCPSPKGISVSIEYLDDIANAISLIQGQVDAESDPARKEEDDPQ